MPPAEVEIAIDKPEWESTMDALVRKVGMAAQTAYDMADKPKALKKKTPEISILLTSDEIVQQLNSQYRGKDTPTNVLSFPQIEEDAVPDEDLVLLGDIILAFETVTREAAEKKIPLETYIAHLVVHGTLHLLGYDHKKDDDAEAMESLENKIMERLGYDRPHAV